MNTVFEQLLYTTIRIECKNSVRKNIRAICKDETVQKVIKDFDSSHLQIMKRLVNTLIQCQCILALMILFKIKR